MKRLIVLAAFASVVSFSAMAQSYSSLWKQVERAEQKDLPQDQLAVLDIICSKAQRENEWGNLLKAQLQRIAVEAAMTPDSLLPQLRRYEEQAATCEGEVLRAVCAATLGHIYKNYWQQLDMAEDSAKVIAARYYGQSLENPALLAGTKAKTYDPLIVKGDNVFAFGDDLLHVIGFEAEAYGLLHDYYESVGNRAAACLSACMQLRNAGNEYREASKKSRHLARIDSLIHVYQDLPEAGELAVERFNFMDGATDVSVEEKVEYIDYALLQWPSWSRMAVLRNAKDRMTLPSFHAIVPETLFIPGREIPVYISSLTNLTQLRMDVYRVDVTGAEEFDPQNAEDYKVLKSKLSAAPVASDSRVYYGLPNYRQIRDTLRIRPLPVGVYMVELTTDNSGVAVERLLLHVTNLRVIDMDLPDDIIRLVAVNATTGKPVAGAKISLEFREWTGREWTEDKRVLTTESDGEVRFSSTLSPRRYRVVVGDDVAFPWQSISQTRWTVQGNDRGKGQTVKVFTDRSIYRPGHEVQVSALAYEVVSQEEWKAADGAKLHLILRDNSNKTVDEKDVVTDEWGVATATFGLPADGTTGTYMLRSTWEGNTTGTTSIKVEEYKRPTFSVRIDGYESAYKEGDTITVRAWAKRYSGMPVQNATVKYSVSNAFVSWWRMSNTSSSGGRIFSGTAETADDGSFLMKVPMLMPDGERSGKRFAKVTVSATVTDGAGESHGASVSYPLSDKPAAFGLSDFGDKLCRERQTPFTFVYVNNAGNDIDATLSYSVDGGAAKTVATNTDTMLDISQLASGRHVLRAVCRGDSIEQSFILFSLDDAKAPVDTAAWYYSTSGEVPNYTMKEDQAETVQIGTTRQDQTVFYAIASDSELLECGQLTINDELLTRRFTYKREWGNGLAVRFTWVRDGKQYSYQERLSRPVRDHSLQMEWQTFRDRLVPGQNEEWTLTVRNADGTPAKAQTMAVLYDKSLDALRSHGWSLDRSECYYPPTIAQFADYNVGRKYVYGEQTFRPQTEPTLEFWHFSIPPLVSLADLRFAISDVALTASSRMMRASAVTMGLDEAETVTAEEATVVVSGDEGVEAEFDTSGVQVREDLDETAFFMPQLVTDRNGLLSIKFTLPESVTTWRFLSVAHDKDMNIGHLEGEAVAQKQLMVQPNVPRFIRQGDSGQISATISNNSPAALNGQATLTLTDPRTEKAVFTQKRTFRAEANKTASVTFSLPSGLDGEAYVCKVVAQSGTFSDGEQHYLPVLPNTIEVTTTKAFTQTSAGTSTIDLSGLYGANASNESLTVEYTNNPVWLMLEALPVVAEPDAANAISLSTALYANRITERLKRQLPNDSLLGKDLPVTASEIASKLLDLQNRDGSFSWFAGMRPSRYVTQFVAKTLARMKHLGLLAPSSDEKAMLDEAMDYLDAEISSYVRELKRLEDKDETRPVPSEMAMDYLYIQAIKGDSLTASAKSNAQYLLGLLTEASPQLTIEGKANMAVVFATHPATTYGSLAADLLESVRQYSVKTETMGRYFDTPKAPYSWRDYRIPTQTAAIEALQTIAPDDRETIADMQQWLLQEKRTQQWNTPINSASAIYVFFNGWNFAADSEYVAKSAAAVEPVRLAVDGKTVVDSEKLEGKGYVKQSLEGRHTSFSAEKSSDNVSWGAVYVTFTQPLEDVEQACEGIAVSREVVDEDGNRLAAPPAVGQKVKVRITVTAERDLDFVEVVDNRAACLEPVVQSSGYRNGCYIAPLDNRTTFHFDKLAKGRHIVEADYYVDRAGSYRFGTATAKCCYAPEFQARSTSITIETE